METLEWATLRSVAPENLLDYGRAIPTIFVPGWLDPWPVAPAAARSRSNGRGPQQGET